MSDANARPRASNTKSSYTCIVIIGLLIVAFAFILVTLGNLLESHFENLAFALPGLILSLVIAGLVWKYGRWALVVAVIYAVLGLLFISGFFEYGLGNPNSFFDFVPNVLLLVGIVLGLVGGTVAFIQRRRSDPRTVLTGLERRTLGAIGVVLVALAVMSGVLMVTERASVSAQDRVGAIELRMKAVQFKPEQLEVEAGKPARVVIENDDLLVHTFTIKEMDIDVVVGPKSEVLVALPSVGPGTFLSTPAKCRATRT